MTMDKLFDGSDAHLLPSNAELIQRLLSYTTPAIYSQDAKAMREAAGAIEAAGKRIEELEASVEQWKCNSRENKMIAESSELKLVVARKALTNIYCQTQEGVTHALATEALIAIHQEALAQIGGAIS